MDSERLKLAAMKAAAYVPEALWRPVGNAAMARVVAKNGKPVQQWRLNAEVVMGEPPTDEQTRQAMRSWLRNTVGSLQLGRWDADRINRTVVIADRDRELLLDLHHSTGLVIALPHMGSWDLAGAWGCVNGLPVTSVAENLPQGQFEYFQKLRGEVGMEIFRAKEGRLVSKLVDTVKAGRVACLVADRSFGSGLPVNWPTATGSVAITAPPGPALVSRLSGATLVPVAAHFVGPSMVINVGEPIAPVASHDGLEQMTQQVIDYFGTQVQKHLIDWHMLQRFFPGVQP